MKSLGSLEGLWVLDHSFSSLVYFVKSLEVEGWSWLSGSADLRSSRMSWRRMIRQRQS